MVMELRKKPLGRDFDLVAGGSSRQQGCHHRGCSIRRQGQKDRVTSARACAKTPKSDPNYCGNRFSVASAQVIHIVDVLVSQTLCF